jgi:hypothetical protein
MKISPQATCLRRPCHSRARVRPACPRRWRSHRCRRVAFQDACGARATKTESKNLKTVSKNLWMKEWERCGGGDALAEHLVAGEDHCVRAAADCARHGAANRRPRPAQRCTLDLPRQPVQNEDLPACNGGVHFEDMKGTLLAVAPHRDRYPNGRERVSCNVWWSKNRFVDKVDGATVDYENCGLTVVLAVSKQIRAARATDKHKAVRRSARSAPVVSDLDSELDSDSKIRVGIRAPLPGTRVAESRRGR